MPQHSNPPVDDGVVGYSRRWWLLWVLLPAVVLTLLGIWFWDTWTTDPSDRAPGFGANKIIVVFPAMVLAWVVGLIAETGKRAQARRKKRLALERD